MVNRGFLLANDAVAVTAYAGSMNTPLAQDLTILTGASRGMGLALARQLMRPGHLLLCLSRHVNPELEHEARAAGVHLEQWAQDLGDAGEAVERLEALAVQPASARDQQRDADQQRWPATGNRPARGLPARAAGPGAARRAGSADAAERRLPARDPSLGRCRLAGRAQAAQHLVGAGPARHGRAVALLRGQGRARPFQPLRRARAGTAAAWGQGGLAGARRDRHRHAGPDARRRSAALPGPGTLRGVAPAGPADQPRAGGRAGAGLAGTARLWRPGGRRRARLRPSTGGKPWTRSNWPG